MADKEREQSPTLMGRIKSAIRADQAEVRSVNEEADRNDARVWKGVKDTGRKAGRAVKRYGRRRAGRTL